ncbi:hypothetical protein DSECCO2_660650 [anaerobic digester metagenome]
MHHRDRHGLVRAHPELRLFCPVRIERAGPGSFEGDRVRDDEPGHGIDRGGRQEVANLPPGSPFDPPVDRLPRRIGGARKVKVRRVRRVPALRESDVLREERIRLLRPEGVCRLNGAVSPRDLQAGIEPGKPLPPKGVVCREMENRPDLIGGRAAGALIGDRKGRRYAVRREKEVFRPRIVCEAPVEVASETVAARNDAFSRPIVGRYTGSTPRPDSVLFSGDT